MKFKEIHRILTSLLSLVLVGCATVDGGPAKPPVGLSDGINTFQFVYRAPFLLDRNYLDVKTSYTGQWVGNRPKGRGEAINNYGRRCSGEFGVSGYAANLDSEKQYIVWAKGDVYANNTLIFSGVFVNTLLDGESCVPNGQGVWIAKDWKITGDFAGTVTSRQESNKIFVYNFLKEGPCSISLKDGTSYVGTCKAPAIYPATRGFISLDNLDDPLTLALPTGTFTDPNGRRLSAEESRLKVANIQSALLARKAAQDREMAAAALEARRLRFERAEEEARQAAVNRQGLLAIAGAAVIGQSMSGRNYTDSQRSAVGDAWTQDRINAAQGVKTDNFSGAAETARAEIGQGNRSPSAAALALTESSKASQSSAPRSSTRKREPRQPFTEVDPYEANRLAAKEKDRWGSVGFGKGPEREAACSLAQSKGQAEISHLSTIYRADAVSPCVCRVNFLMDRRDLDSMAESGLPDYWDCTIYWKSTKVGDAGSRSK